jgi:hypothetical protein
MRLLQLTRVDGATIWVGEGILIETVTPLDGAALGARSRIWVSGQSRFLRETAESVALVWETQL